MKVSQNCHKFSWWRTHLAEKLSCWQKSKNFSLAPKFIFSCSHRPSNSHSLTMSTTYTDECLTWQCTGGIHRIIFMEMERTWDTFFRLRHLSCSHLFFFLLQKIKINCIHGRFLGNLHVDGGHEWMWSCNWNPIVWYLNSSSCSN